MKRIILATILASFATSAALAQQEACEKSSRQLYKEIIVFSATEQMKPDEGFVGKRLDHDLKLLKNSSLSLVEKVHSLEAGFAKCFVDLSHEEVAQIQSDIELFSKSKNPLITE